MGQIRQIAAGAALATASIGLAGGEARAHDASITVPWGCVRDDGPEATVQLDGFAGHELVGNGVGVFFYRPDIGELETIDSVPQTDLFDDGTETVHYDLRAGEYEALVNWQLDNDNDGVFTPGVDEAFELVSHFVIRTCEEETTTTSTTLDSTTTLPSTSTTEATTTTTEATPTTTTEEATTTTTTEATTTTITPTTTNPTTVPSIVTGDTLPATGFTQETETAIIYTGLFSLLAGLSLTALTRRRSPESKA